MKEFAILSDEKITKQNEKNTVKKCNQRAERQRYCVVGNGKFNSLPKGQKIMYQIWRDRNANRTKDAASDHFVDLHISVRLWLICVPCMCACVCVCGSEQMIGFSSSFLHQTISAYILYMLLFDASLLCRRTNHGMMILRSRFSIFIKWSHTHTSLFLLTVWRCDKFKPAKQNEIKESN